MEDAMSQRETGQIREHDTLFVQMAREQLPLPRTYSLTRLTKMTRNYLAQVEEIDATQLAHLTEPDDPLARIAWSYLAAPIQNSGTLPDDVEAQAIKLRAKVLHVLAVANNSAVDRREHACKLAIEHPEFFTGLAHQLGKKAPYQLGDERPWWRPGNIESNDLARLDLDGDPRKLAAEGFIQIEREEYLRRTRTAIMQSLITKQPTLLTELSAIITVYTASRSERRRLAALQSSLYSKLAISLISELEARGILVPMQPLYSLPREARGMETFFISRAKEAEKLVVDANTEALYSPENEDFRVMLKPGEEPHQTSLFFFQRDLVNHGKNTRRKNSFIELKLSAAHDRDKNTLATLLRGIEELEVDARTLEHLPRVCAGMFTAAQKDRRLGFGWPGTFWDTESGRRLCQVVGFDPGNPRHRSRIQDIRRLLETVILHRQVKGPNGRMKWSGPIIERRASEISIEAKDREGITERNVFHSWSIAKELWDMVIPAHQGGTPSFMRLDERAFELDASSSVPFNLYWTIVNRAYMGSYTSVMEDRVNEEGVFKPKIGTLYKWAGLEGRHNRPYRLREVLTETFDLMKSHGLITHWACKELMPESNTNWQELLDARVELGLSREQLKSLKESADSLGDFPTDNDALLQGSLENALDATWN